MQHLFLDEWTWWPGLALLFFVARGWVYLIAAWLWHPVRDRAPIGLTIAVVIPVYNEDVEATAAQLGALSGVQLG